MIIKVVYKLNLDMKQFEKLHLVFMSLIEKNLVNQKLSEISALNNNVCVTPIGLIALYKIDGSLVITEVLRPYMSGTEN